MLDSLENAILTSTILVAENVLLRGNIDNLRNEARALQDICVHSVIRTGELESQLQSTWQLVLTCTEVLNRQRNLLFTNIPEEFQPSAASRIKALRETLWPVF